MSSRKNRSRAANSRLKKTLQQGLWDLVEDVAFQHLTGKDEAPVAQDSDSENSQFNAAPWIGVSAAITAAIIYKFSSR